MVIHNLVFLVYLILNVMQQLLPDDVNDGNIIEQNNQDNFPATDSRHHITVTSGRLQGNLLVYVSNWKI